MTQKSPHGAGHISSIVKLKKTSQGMGFYKGNWVQSQVFGVQKKTPCRINPLDPILGLNPRITYQDYTLGFFWWDYTRNLYQDQSLGSYTRINPRIQLKSAQVKSIQLESTQVNSSQLKLTQVNSSQLKSTQINSSQLKSTQVNLNQLKSTQIN